MWKKCSQTCFAYAYRKVALYKKINTSISLKENYMDDQIYTLVLMGKERRRVCRVLGDCLMAYSIHTLPQFQGTWWNGKEAKNSNHSRKDKSKNLLMEAVCPLVERAFFFLERHLESVKRKSQWRKSRMWKEDQIL